ncbi:MAG: IS3 family transposase [Burkholderiales bacterium]
MEANRAEYKITAMCRLYAVTRAGYYAWRLRERSERESQNARLTERIRSVHRQSRGTYGSPRVHRALARGGCRVSENRVARLMRADGIRARVATIRYTNPSMQRYYAAIPNRQLEINLTGPDQVWVGDITYLKVGGIYRYLAVVMDKCSRRVLGWSFGKNKDVKLTLRALNRAVHNRRPHAGLIFHTDRGIEYAAHAFKERLADLNITQSMNRPGKVTDNAYIESFFHSMKADIVHGLTFAEDRQIRRAVRTYVPFYNNTRLHSSLNYVSPATFERLA